MRSRQRRPGNAAIIGAEHVAFVVVIQAPARGVNDFGVRRIKDDVVDDEVVARSQVSKRRPRIASVLGNEQLCRAGSQ